MRNIVIIIMMMNFVYRWSQGLLFHQAMVDCARAAILIPLAHSLLYCVPVKKCSLVETAFLLLVTVSTINMLTIVLNDSPVFPEDDEEDGYQVRGRCVMRRRDGGMGAIRVQILGVLKLLKIKLNGISL
jgi:hypothetical protein